MYTLFFKYQNTIGKIKFYGDLVANLSLNALKFETPILNLSKLNNVLLKRGVLATHKKALVFRALVFQSAH